MRIVATDDDDTQDFGKVELRDSGNTGRKTPHCNEHGAMNKVYDDGQNEYWACKAINERGPGAKEVVDKCDAGCREVQSDEYR